MLLEDKTGRCHWKEAVENMTQEEVVGRRPQKMTMKDDTGIIHLKMSLKGITGKCH